jgi:hypothetical protein
MHRSTRIVVLALLLAGITPAKKRPESPPGLPSLADRYDKISCAVVQIIHNGGMGTGFFVSGDGDVLTASHVALDRVFGEPAPGQISLTIDYKSGLRIVRNGQPPQLLSLPKLQQSDVQQAMSDLAVLKTGFKTACYLPLSLHPSDTRIGQHVIAIGYPESAPTGALYEGFVSARYRHLQIPVATVNNKPLYPTYDVIRVQMPITPGASGGPIIVDDGDVIRVITENPTLWFNDLNNLIQFEQMRDGGFSAPVSDLGKMLAKLAWVVQQFVTSGAGLAVPVSYLVQEKTAAQPPSPKATTPEPRSHRGLFRFLLDHLK